MAPAVDPIIKVRDVTVQFGATKVLNGLDLDVRRGEILGFVGPRDMSMAIRQKIGRDVVEVLKDQQVRDRLNQSGQPAAPMNTEEFTAGVNEQRAQVDRIAKLLNIPRKK